MRYAVRPCADRRDHPIHVSGPRPIQGTEELHETLVCPGDRTGERLVRTDDLADLAEWVRRTTPSHAETNGDDEPDLD